MQFWVRLRTCDIVLETVLKCFFSWKPKVVLEGEGGSKKLISFLLDFWMSLQNKDLMFQYKEENYRK